LDTQPGHVRLRRLSDFRLEHALQVRRREIRLLSERREREVLVEIRTHVTEERRQRLPGTHQAVFAGARAAVPPAPSHAPVTLRTNPPITNGSIASVAPESPGQSSRMTTSIAR